MYSLPRPTTVLKGTLMELPLSDPRPVGRMLQDQAERYGDKPFLLFEAETVSYREMCDRASRFAAVLWARGVRKGDKVGVLCSNRPEFLYAVYGILLIGAVEVPINTGYKGDLLAYVIDQSETTALVIEADLITHLLEVRMAVPKLARLWVIGGLAMNEALPWPTETFDAVTGNPGPLPDVEVLPSDLSGIVYTSGTTGPSKGVMCTHHYFYNFAAGWSRAVRLTPDDVYYTPLPYFHFAAQIGTTYTALVTGATVVMGRRFVSAEFWDVMRRYHVTGVTLLGSLCHLLYKESPSQKDRDHCVRFCWTAPAPAAVFHEFVERFGVRLLEGYGMTETNIPLHTPYDDPRPGSCGKPWGAFEVEIVDEYDWPVTTGVVGEIVTRPCMPWIMMDGYYRMPDKTAEAFGNMWFHTGDQGRKDSDGYFYFVDRAKDRIRRKGENISSYDIEHIVNDHPAVLESVAIGIPVAMGEDEVKVVLVLRCGASLAPEEVIRFCAKRMPHFMVPQYVEFAAELPKTPNGKVQKQKLRAAGITEGTWNRSAAGIRLRGLT